MHDTKFIAFAWFIVDAMNHDSGDMAPKPMTQQQQPLCTNATQPHLQRLGLYKCGEIMGKRTRNGDLSLGIAHPRFGY